MNFVANNTAVIYTTKIIAVLCFMRPNFAANQKCKRMDATTLQQITAGAAGVMVVMSAADLKSAMAAMFQEHEAKTAAAIEAHREKPTLTRQQAAQALNVTLSTLWRWARDGYLTPCKIGNKTLYRATDIDKILKSRNRQST